MKHYFSKINLSMFALVLVGILYYMQDQYMISQGDDYMYQFIVPNDSRPFNVSLIDPQVERIPITSFSDVIESNKNAYMNSNGRFLVHCIVQTCCTFLSQNVFVVINTIMFLLFVFLVVKLSKVKELIQIAIVVCLFWLLMYKGQTFFYNMANSVNYLWCSVANLFFLLCHNKINDSEERFSKWYWLLGLFLLGLIIGSLSESFSIGISAGLFVYYIFHRNNLSRTTIFLLLGYFLGTAFVVLAPGNFSRVEGRGMGSFNIFVLYQLLTVPVNLAYLVALVIMRFMNREQLKKHIINNMVLLLSVVFNAFFMMFVAYNGKHQQTAINVMCLILLSNLFFSGFKFSIRTQRIVASILVIVSMIIYIPVLQLRKSLFDSYNSCLSKVSTKGITLVDEEYQKYTYKMRMNFLYHDYFIYVQNIIPRHASMIITEGKDLFYIANTIPFPKEKFEEFCTDDRKYFDNVYQGDYGYVFCKLDNDVPMQSISLNYNEAFGFFFHRDAISVAKPFRKITYNGHYYYVFQQNLKGDRYLSLEVENEVL